MGAYDKSSKESLVAVAEAAEKFKAVVRGHLASFPPVYRQDDVVEWAGVLADALAAARDSREPDGVVVQPHVLAAAYDAWTQHPEWRGKDKARRRLGEAIRAALAALAGKEPR